MVRFGLTMIVVGVAASAGCGPGFSADDDGPDTATSTATATAGTTSVGSSSAVTSDSSPTTTTLTTQGGSSAVTTVGGGPECTVDTDCMLLQDCCSCLAFGPGEIPPMCPADCEQSACDSYGVTTALCRFGQCAIQKLGCNPQNAFCDVPPPLCEAGTQPEVQDGCWTGRCLPPEVCDWVADCSACRFDEVCVTQLGGPGGLVTQRRCEPVPADCNGVPDCQCAGPLLCEAGSECSAAPQRLDCIAP